MRWGGVLSTSAATLAVVGCAVLVIGMDPAPRSTSERPSVGATQFRAPVAQQMAVPAVLADPAVTAGTTPAASGAPGGTTSRAAATSVAPPRASQPAVTATPRLGTPASRPSAAPAAAVAKVAPATSPARKPVPAARPPATKPAAPVGTRLPLSYSTGSATRVLTVTAPSTGSTVATLQPWTKVAGGWRKVGSSVTAHIGADGMSTHPSESRSATPMGSFTLTQAFGYNSNPGTNLPYFTTTPADYWISDAGSNYNTHQRCPSYNTGCDNDGVNERLYYETPYYNYAVVIDYNTQNAPGGVRAGAGSAFFLHVYPAGTGATAGCVAIPQASLVSIMRWLTPSAHPRILIGTV